MTYYMRGNPYKKIDVLEEENKKLKIENKQLKLSLYKMRKLINRIIPEGK